MGSVYVCLLPFSNIGFWILGLCELGITAGAFTAMMVLRDESVSIGEWDKKFLLWVAVTMTIVLAALGVAATLLTFAEPSLLANSGKTVFYSWENNFGALGYPEGELVERYRHAVSLASLVLLAYMVFVVGGKLIVALYRLDDGDSPRAAASSGMPQPVAVSRESPQPRRRLDVRYWLRSLDRRRRLRPFDGLGNIHSHLERERSPASTAR